MIGQRHQKVRWLFKAIDHPVATLARAWASPLISYRLATVATILGACFLIGDVALSPAIASDHADPIKVRFLGRPESNLTGLFAFEQNDKLVLALCARPGLVDKDLDLTALRFAIKIDVNSNVQFSDSPTMDEGRTFRYGGWVREPEKITEDITLTFRFDQSKRNPLATAAVGSSVDVRPAIKTESKDVQRTLDRDLKSWVGIRDDPFILHGFSTTNVVAMVVELPLPIIKEDDTLLIWGTCSQHGRQIDHVGRSLRTMLPRFDYLNSLHPSEHVETIRRKHEEADVGQDVMSYVASPIFGIRHYDFEPDVMIFSRRRWRNHLHEEALQPSAVDINHETIAFPNGRRLTDDVAKLMCDRGDCLLFEVSTAEAHADHVERPTTNGTPFLNEFPYLAAPNADPTPAELPSLRTRTIVILIIVALIIAFVFVLPWYLFIRTRLRLRRALSTQ